MEEAEKKKVEQYLQHIKKDLFKLLKSAPEFGSCGIVVTFHAGKITKVSTHSEVTQLEVKNNTGK